MAATVPTPMTQRIVLYMYNSLNILFHNCSFQNSLGQSVVLSEVSGNVYINNCNFTHNNNYNNSSDKSSITFTNNFARIVGNSIYQDVADSCSRSCLIDRVVGISIEFIATPPNELKFYDPAICIDDDYDTQCNAYYAQDIMLGSDIVILACVFDHYNHSVESTQFLVQSEFNPNYNLSGPKQVLIGCNTFTEITILGNQVLSNSTNLSVNINLHVDHNTDWKQISVTLVVQLSECHPDFWQPYESQQCECYSANDIVFCSGSSSTIKRGYWFGSVMGKPTVTFCPINYRNFTCCETSNRYYYLSPVRNRGMPRGVSGNPLGFYQVLRKLFNK